MNGGVTATSTRASALSVISAWASTKARVSLS